MRLQSVSCKDCLTRRIFSWRGPPNNWEMSNSPKDWFVATNYGDFKSETLWASCAWHVNPQNKTQISWFFPWHYSHICPMDGSKSCLYTPDRSPHCSIQAVDPIIASEHSIIWIFNIHMVYPCLLIPGQLWDVATSVLGSWSCRWSSQKACSLKQRAGFCGGKKRAGRWTNNYGPYQKLLFKCWFHAR